MTPTLTEINRSALDPYLEGTLPAKSALSTGSNTLKEFLVKIPEKMIYQCLLI